MEELVDLELGINQKNNPQTTTRDLNKPLEQEADGVSGTSQAENAFFGELMQEFGTEIMSNADLEAQNKQLRQDLQVSQQSTTELSEDLANAQVELEWLRNMATTLSRSCDRWSGDIQRSEDELATEKVENAHLQLETNKLMGHEKAESAMREELDKADKMVVELTQCLCKETRRLERRETLMRDSLKKFHRLEADLIALKKEQSRAEHMADLKYRKRRARHRRVVAELKDQIRELKRHK